MSQATPRTLVGAVLLLAAGCATATDHGEMALQAGRNDEAVAYFQAALAREPGDVVARVGLGVARYRSGALDEAERALGDALSRAPGLPVTSLYLGLIAILRGQDAAAAESLRRYAASTEPRIGADVERALRALGSGPVTADMRQYVAASLEAQSAWAGELMATQRALANSELRRMSEDRTLLLLPACRCR